MAKNKKQPPEVWEIIGENRKFVRLFIGMLDSNAFKQLKPRQRALYLYMKAQYNGKETKNNPNSNKNQFYFNWALASKKYKLYTSKDTFYKDIKKLIECGFIVCSQNNRNLREKNVYAFSDKWKQ